MLLIVRLLRVSLPFSALLPLQEPEAVQAVVLVLLQLNVVLPPAVIFVGLAERFKTGAPPPPAVVTVTVVERLTPPQVRVKVLVAVRFERTSLPLVVLVPLQKPDAVHVVAPVLLQFKVLLPPEVTLAGLADKLTLTVGTGVGVALGGGSPHRSFTTEFHDLKLVALWQSSQSKPVMLQWPLLVVRPRVVPLWQLTQVAVGRKTSAWLVVT